MNTILLKQEANDEGKINIKFLMGSNLTNTDHPDMIEDVVWA